MYRAPVSDIAFTLKHVAGLGEALASDAIPGLTEDVVDAVLAEAGRFATEELAPLNVVGDRQGSTVSDGHVTTPDGWKPAYQAWTAAGWNGIAAPGEHGGQGLPLVLAAATQELWNGACMAFSLCPMLTMGAIEALHRHGSEALKALYLPRMVSGEWAGTMNLTEAQAGSDLGTLRTRAEPQADRSYRLYGQKIFITYGEHDLTENIVHMVLARLPDAPAGSKGISLFLVPKFLVNDDGSLGERNDLFCASLEEKLGIHASPTCTMIYGDGRYGEVRGAVGWLVGEPNRGLAAMFTMMNNARLMVGVQGVGMAERATQQATAYARERRQGRAVETNGEGMSPIIEHPDIRRTLMKMRALTAASRCICYACGFAADRGASVDGAAEASDAKWRAEFLTPIAKAFSTDIAVEVASLGVQVFGGAGYIEESGAAQTLRDSRISPIYEGTNGIQAIDLVTRKLPVERGAPFRRYIAELRESAERARAVNRPEFGRMGARVAAALDDCEATGEHLLTLLEDGKTAEALAGATSFLRLSGLAIGGAYLAKGALASQSDSDAQASLRIAIARFMAEHLLPETAALKSAVIDGAEAVVSVDPDVLSA
jgi:alkylation response protein AidB-like acyl-CoA dehydrogenase